MEALLAQDVGDGMILMYDHHHHRPLVTAPGGVAGDGADERQDAHLELAGQQALVEQALLDPSQVGVRNAEEQHGSGGTIRGEGQALLRIERPEDPSLGIDRKSTRLNSSHQIISYAVFCLKKKNIRRTHIPYIITPPRERCIPPPYPLT